MRGLRRKGRIERTGFELYGCAVAAARAPWFYARLGVPDTLDGRFDMVGLLVWLTIRELRRRPDPGPALAQAVFDAMFSDMDLNLRELGVGDLSVGKKVKAMWEALHGRAAAYEAAAVTSSDPQALQAALARNVWRAATAPGAAELAEWVRRQIPALASVPNQALFAGRIVFLAPQEVPA
ncbi:MAG: ubiquinol-cytochrome C chaperone family protein [Acetobacteraceae bacterium]|nr:ubiquinol-cytochrome C chaperone family protein [Acetobacteraceae bacterium]